MHASLVIKARSRSDTLAMEACKQRRRAGAVKAFVVKENAAVQSAGPRAGIGKTNLRITRVEQDLSRARILWNIPSPEPIMEPTPELHSTPLPAPVPPHHNAFFFGRFGLRAGYGILIFVILFGLIATLSGQFAVFASGQLHEMMAARNWNHAHPNGPKHHFTLAFAPLFVIVNDGVSFLLMLLIAFFFSKAERRPLRSYGIGAHRMQDILPGAFWGLAMLSGVVAVLRAKHLLIFDAQNLHGAAIFRYGIAWLLAFLLVGFSEEYTFRGYIQYTLMRGFWGLAERISATQSRAVAFWLAAAFWSGAFAFAHVFNAGENRYGVFQVFLAGITFSYALWRTGSLWWGIGFHCTWDWAQSFLFGVADSGNLSVGRLFITHPQGKPLLSGGDAGPEGSIFATVALILTVLILRFATRPGIQPQIDQEPLALAETHSVVPSGMPV